MYMSMNNNAPEKIYVHKSQYWGLMVNEKDITKNGIEYTRTDAFIEKACEAYCKVCDTQECIVMGECSWAQKYKKQLLKIMKE